MSRKPYIKIVYPDASEIAMLLTEAMVCRASGKRVVETESSERESAAQDLFAGSLCCVTETSVELTLNLAPEAMDFALATLIAKNLTQTERDKAMAASDSLELDALFSCAQAGAGASTCTEEVGTLCEPTEDAQQSEEAEKAGQKEMPSLCYKTIAVFGIILATIERVPKTKKMLSEINFLKRLGQIAISHLIKNLDEEEKDFFHAKVMAEEILNETPPTAGDPDKLTMDLTGILYDEDHGIRQKEQEPSWDDVEAEARKIEQHKTDETDKTDDIEPGLLNDIEADDD